MDINYSFKRRGLKQRLMVLSLGLALVPLIIVSTSIFITARNNQIQTANRTLQSASQSSLSFIENWFDHLFIDLKNQSTNQDNARFLTQLTKEFRASKLGLSEYVKSPQWDDTTASNGNNLRNFMRNYGYYDVFLIDKNGDILFTAAQENDLGTNIFSGENAHSLFAGSCRQTIATGLPSFSDLDRYAPSQNRVCGFLTSVILDENEDLVGLFCIQLSVEKIVTALHNPAHSAASGNIYLVGPSKAGNGTSLRTPFDKKSTKASTGSTPESSYFRSPIDTRQTQLWEQAGLNGRLSEKTPGQGTILVYPGPDGQEVIGIHSNVSIGNIHWGLIVEIPTEQAFAQTIQMQRWVPWLVIFFALLVSLIASFLTRKLVLPIAQLSKAAKLVSQGDLDQKVVNKDTTEVGELALSFNSMVESLRKNQKSQDQQRWLETTQSELLLKIRGENDISTLGSLVTAFLAQSFGAQIGAFYTADEYENLELTGSYGLKNNKKSPLFWESGEGLVGQAAQNKEPITLSQIPADYLEICSSLGNSSPRHIMIWPIVYENQTRGVIELGSFEPFAESSQKLLASVSEGIAVALISVRTRLHLQTLLENSQAQAEELHAQTEMLTEREAELQKTNLSLSQKTERLQTSEELLQQQSEELQVINEQLMENSTSLEKEKMKLHSSKLAVEKTAKKLASANQYKSEFLANMSHELRTPLNSLLILSKSLAENGTGNLTEDQVKAAEIIHGGGEDLLSLINNILDLSKIEAGKQELSLAPMKFDDLTSKLDTTFNNLAKENSLELIFENAAGLPEGMVTDSQKLEQILRNLISNAFKFTHQGFVKVHMDLSDKETEISGNILAPGQVVIISVIDSGVGIAQDKQKAIFESFQQADGSTSRIYGGTGLGLTISRQFSQLLGGQIVVESTLGEGSKFILLLPLHHGDSVTKHDQSVISEKDNDLPVAIPVSNPEPPTFLVDDRHNLKANGRTILIAEDDKNFAQILVNLCHQKGFQCLVTPKGSEALHLLGKYHPDAVFLDIALSDLNGLSILDEIKNNLAQRHIPVHIISGLDKKSTAMKMGAIGFLMKPTTSNEVLEALATVEDELNATMHHLLGIENDHATAELIADAIQFDNVKITETNNSTEGMRIMSDDNICCLILGEDKNGRKGKDLLHLFEDQLPAIPPCIVLGDEEISQQDRREIESHGALSLSLDTPSLNIFVDKASLFLHSVEASLPEERKNDLHSLHNNDGKLNGKKVLVVDDEVRNTFAMTSLLEDAGMNVCFAENGQLCLDVLEEDQDFDIILMDIMMPVMDGYETCRRIRSTPLISQIPIIALTAKAMPEDREKCIAAGASDYLDKPVRPEQLLSLIRVWTFNMQSLCR